MRLEKVWPGDGRRVVALGDLHGALLEVPVCDVRLLAADLPPVTDHAAETQARWPG